MYKKFLFLISFVLVLSLASISYAADERTIKLDLNNTENNDDANTHPGFTKFSIPNSGSEVNSVVIDLGGNIDSRLRVDPNGRDFDDIYRDFIFGISPSGVTITLWGLGVNRDCNITLWAYDHQSLPTRHAEWWATWGDACDANYLFITDHNGGAENWPAGDGSTNYFATAKTDYLGRIIMTSTIGPNSPEGQPFAFVNALMVEPKGTFVETNYAHRPQPVDGAEGVPVNEVLKWRKGGLSEKRDVYLGTVFDDVNTATRSNPKGVLVSQNQDANTFDLTGHIVVGQTYYWRVDEVNTTPPPNSYWKGEVWSFSTFTIGQPIAWWKLDEGSGSIAHDSTVYNYDANIYGNPVWKTSGSPYGGSGYLDFDGDGDFTDANYIDNNDIELDEYTVTLWFRSEGPGLEANRDMFAAVGPNDTDGHGILLELRGSEGGRIRYIHRSPVQQSGTYNENLYTPRPTSYDDNVWHHIAVVRSTSAGTTGRYIYIDGDDANSITDARPPFDRPLRIMLSILRNQLRQRYWDGGIDDVRIYDRPLSPGEIREVMRSKIASAPNPADGATDVVFTPTLSWLPGLYAADVNGHKVYLDPDEDNVEERSGCQINGVVTTDPCYGPIGPLSVGQTYYWAIDEVNDACSPYLWAGDIWHFTTRDYLIVEDFDSYVGNEELRAVWNDYWYNGTSAEVYIDDIIARDGISMRYFYDNDYSPYYSDVEASIAALGFLSDWLNSGAKAMSLWFYGRAGNPVSEQMYIGLSDGDGKTAFVPYDGDMNDVKKEEWQEWNILLQDFVDANDVNLSDVNSIIIRFGEPGGLSGTEGTVNFDDIRLYASKCVLSEREPDFALLDFAPVGYSISGDCKVDNQELTIMADDWLAEDGLVATEAAPNDFVAYYPLDEGDGNKAECWLCDHNGILRGDVSWIAPGFNGYWYAIHVPFIAGSRVDINTWNPVGNWNPDTNTGELTLALWAKWAGPTGVPQGLICKRDLVWDVNGLMFGFEITDWPAYTTNMLALRGAIDVTSGGDTMDNYLGKWTHLAATYPHPSGDPCDPNLFARLYINGREVASGAFIFGPNSVASMAIGNTTGKNGDADNQTFNGDIDEVYIYDQVLTVGQIAWLCDKINGYPDDQWHIPVPSHAELYEEEPEGQRYVNFKDFALIADVWLQKEYWP